MKSLLVQMSGLFCDENWHPENADVLDFRDLQGTAGYLDPESDALIERAFSKHPLHALHWIDSGDYHYLTDIWLRFLRSPARLFLFDNHPDDQAPAFGESLLSCGSWVAHCKKNNPFLDDSSENAYISIDLDYLGRDYARTNWDQGSATLDELLASLDEIKAQYRIEGVDICGGISSAQGGTAEDFAINRRTREVLNNYFREV